MMKRTFEHIDLGKIDLNDATFCYSTTNPEGTLIASITNFGVINPITVQKVNENYRIVTGFKRTKAMLKLGLDTCPAFISDAAEATLDLFVFAIHDNQAIKSLNPIELAKILEKLQADFNIENERIISEYLPKLGYGRNARVLQLYDGLHKISDSWQSALISDHVPIDFAQEMLEQSIDIQDKMWQLISDCRLGKNRQREVFALLSDVARLMDVPLSQLFDSQDIQNIQHDGKLTPSQKTERLKAWLWEKRYPRYSKVKAEYEAVLRKAHLPQNCHIQSPPYFEGEAFSAVFSFASTTEFAETLVALKKALDDGTIKNIIELT